LKIKYDTRKRIFVLAIFRRIVEKSTVSLFRFPANHRQPMKSTSLNTAAPLEIETETRTVEDTGWVEAGAYHAAYYRHQPEDVRGCPAGRSQHSVAAAVADLLRRTNDESGTDYTAADVTITRHNGQPIPTTTPTSCPPANPQPTNPTNTDTMNTIAIEIATDAKLATYTHAATESDATALRTRIEDLEAAGRTVLAARSARHSVPHCYRSAYKINAPFYIFDPAARSITLVSGKLENRSHGKTIPCHLEISGSAVPAGYRCFQRGESSILVRPA